MALDDSSPLNKQGKKFIQEVTGVFLAVASKQVTPTENAMQKCLQFLDYATSQDNAIITYQASDMRLLVAKSIHY